MATLRQPYRGGVIVCTVLAATLAVSNDARPCTTFCYADGGTIVFGRNYDWNVGDGMVLINKRGVAKQAFVARGGAAWTAAYGSITFNQYGREFPTGGMNEKGLVVELMWLDETEYPPADARGALPTLQWIQYQLDRSVTVDDVIASDRAVRITSSGSAKIHFLVADATGAVATVEFLDGKLVAHRGDQLPYPVLTNDTYARSMNHARAAGQKTGKASPASLDRFARAASHATRATSAADAVRNAFSLLDDVAQGDHTKWSIVYDIRDRRAYFRTLAAPRVRWVDLDDARFACHRPVQMLDINAPLSGDVVTRLEPYTPEANRGLVDAAFDQTSFLAGVPAAERAQLANYPETTRCDSAAKRGK